MNADFKRLMTARFLFTFAVQMQAVVLGWHMYNLTQDPLYLGLVGLVEAIPAIGLALYAGYLIDRSRPLFVYRQVIYVSLLSGILMFVTQMDHFAFSLQAQILALFASSFLTGTARAFSQSAIFAAVPRLVAREELPKASAWLTSAMQVARISGPAFGGVLFNYVGMSGTAACVCVVLICASISMLLIKASPGVIKHEHSHLSLMDELLSGGKFVFAHPILLPALTLDMVSVLFGGVTALLPIYASEILHIGPVGLGFLRAAPAVGAATTSLWLTSIDIKHRAGPWLIQSVAGFGCCILIFALSRDYVVSFVALTLSGAFDSVSAVIRTACVQLSSPDHMRGKISAVNSIFIGSSNELGEFESGVAARLLGTQPAAIFGGCMCLLTVAVLAALNPRLRRLDLGELEL